MPCAAPEDPGSARYCRCFALAVMRRHIQIGRCRKKYWAMIVAPMKVPALAAKDVTTMRQLRRRKAGTSLAIDSPAKARIGVAKARKLIFPVSPATDAAMGRSG